MILAFNYSNEKFRKAQKLNTKSALRHGADKAIEYTENDLDKNFVESNKHFFACKRGGGYWCWKPQIMLDALSKINDGDYAIYCDSGAIYINDINKLIESMEEANQYIMCFAINLYEKYYTKRDLFIALDCDEPRYYDSLQIESGHIIFKKCKQTITFLKEFENNMKDLHLVDDSPSNYGKDNYPGFIENRHDQSVFSLLCKKHGILPFRDASQFGSPKNKEFPKDVINRSKYPQIIIDHRIPNATNSFLPIASSLLWKINMFRKTKINYLVNYLKKIS